MIDRCWFMAGTQSRWLRQGARQWFRLRLGSSVLADDVATVAELERELARYGLTLADFTEAGGWSSRRRPPLR
jgi:hypothetical protein